MSGCLVRVNFVLVCVARQTGTSQRHGWGGFACVHAKFRQVGPTKPVMSHTSVRTVRCAATERRKKKRLVGDGVAVVGKVSFHTH